MHTSTCPLIVFYTLNVFCVEQIANPAPGWIPQKTSTCRRRDQHRKCCAEKQGTPRYGSVSLHCYLLRHHCLLVIPLSKMHLASASDMDWLDAPETRESRERVGGQLRPVSNATHSACQAQQSCPSGSSPTLLKAAIAFSESPMQLLRCSA